MALWSRLLLLPRLLLVAFYLPTAALASASRLSARELADLLMQHLKVRRRASAPAASMAAALLTRIDPSPMERPRRESEAAAPAAAAATQARWLL